MLLGEKLVQYFNKSYPTIITIGRFGRWSLTILKNTFFGIGGIALLVVAGFFVAGALVAEPLRWYFIGIASALLLLCGGVLALSYARSLLNRSFAEQGKQIAASSKAMAYMRKEVASINKGMVDLNKGISMIKDDVFIIGYDILKEQGKLADRVSELETRAGEETDDEQPSQETSQ